ncbi:MAG: PmoA family protein [Planctomycetota bacterium]
MAFPPRCRVEPRPHHSFAFMIDGNEVSCWQAGQDHPRPFLFPIRGPSGRSLTRIGHPGAPNHDHHLSVWFAHAAVAGIDFWSNKPGPRIRQKEWLAQEDGDNRAVLAVRLGWNDGHDAGDLLEQDVVFSASPLGKPGEWSMEIQATLRPASPTLLFQKSNFGLLAVRVAREVSEHFGRGRITGSSGKTGEPALFNQPNAWMDYSCVEAGHEEGITLIDHPENPGHPARWHVRADGWMGPSLTRTDEITLKREKPLVLRYLMVAHSGPADPAGIKVQSDSFALSSRWMVTRSTRPHRFNEVRRSGE